MWKLSVSWNRTDHYIDPCSPTASKDNGEKLGRFAVPVSIQSGLMSVCLRLSPCPGLFPYFHIITLSVRHAAGNLGMQGCSSG